MCARRVSPTKNEPLRGKVGSIMCSLKQRIHFLSYLVFLKPNIPLDFDSHPPSHNQISPRVDEDGVSGYNWCVVSNITELLHPIIPPILTCGHLISCSCCCYIFLFLHPRRFHFYSKRMLRFNSTINYITCEVDILPIN